MLDLPQKVMTWRSTINSDTSQDGQQHLHHDRLKDYIPKTLPYDVVLRITKDGNIPQIQFNDDGVWHDFAPDRTAVKAGPWFPYLWLNGGSVRLSDHCVQLLKQEEQEEEPLPKDPPSYKDAVKGL